MVSVRRCHSPSWLWSVLVSGVRDIVSRTSDPNYIRNRNRLKRRRYLVCWLCGDSIDKRLEYPHPYSFSADHVDPVSRGGSNAGELRPAHLRCNQSRGNGRGVTSARAVINDHVLDW